MRLGRVVSTASLAESIASPARTAKATSCVMRLATVYSGTPSPMAVAASQNRDTFRGGLMLPLAMPNPGGYARAVATAAAGVRGIADIPTASSATPEASSSNREAPLNDYEAPPLDKWSTNAELMSG
eukprot:gene29584-5939_t